MYHCNSFRKVTQHSFQENLCAHCSLSGVAQNGNGGDLRAGRTSPRAGRRAAQLPVLDYGRILGLFLAPLCNVMLDVLGREICGS
jgi:hypothetical protein